MASARSGVLCLPLLGAFTALSFTMLAGCPDPQASFDEFGKRYDKIHNQGSSSVSTGVGGGCSAPMAGELDGQFLFSLSANLKPKKAIALLMDVTTTEENGQLMLKLVATPLSAMDHVTPVADPIDVPAFPVNADGTFDAELGTIAVPGSANPITGSDIMATVGLVGAVCDGKLDFVCGNVTGAADAGGVNIDLEKPNPSLFTMQRVKDGMTPFPAIDCAMTPAVY